MIIEATPGFNRCFLC